MHWSGRMGIGRSRPGITSGDYMHIRYRRGHMTTNLDIPARIDPHELPRWLVEQYPGMEKDIEAWYTSYYFWKRWDGQEANLEEALVRARASAEARYKSLTQTNALKGAADKSFMLQLYEAHKSGWFRNFEEIEDVRELLDHMLADSMEHDPASGTRYETQFLLETMLPTMEQMNVPPELIIGIPQNISKARAAVPVLRRILNEDGPQAQERIMEV